MFYECTWIIFNYAIVPEKWFISSISMCRCKKKKNKTENTEAKQICIDQFMAVVARQQIKPLNYRIIKWIKLRQCHVNWIKEGFVGKRMWRDVVSSGHPCQSKRNAWIKYAKPNEFQMHFDSTAIRCKRFICKNDRPRKWVRTCIALSSPTKSYSRAPHAKPLQFQIFTSSLVFAGFFFSFAFKLVKFIEP